MCGAKHMMEGDPAACLRACVQKGSKYALVVGDKVYTLDTSNQATLDTLDKLAGKKATVKGAADGDTIERELGQRREISDANSGAPALPAQIF